MLHSDILNAFICDSESANLTLRNVQTHPTFVHSAELNQHWGFYCVYYRVYFPSIISIFCCNSFSLSFGAVGAYPPVEMPCQHCGGYFILGDRKLNSRNTLYRSLFSSMQIIFAGGKINIFN